MSARILLVDALALVYRSYFAIPSLSTAAGVPTNALLGFIKTMRQVQEIWKPEYSAVVFDGGIPPKRLELLPEYKAQRPPMPDTLRAQLPLIESYLDRAGIASIRKKPEEADDLLASLALLAAGAELEVLVLSPDKDLMQIVSEQIALIIPGKAEEKVTPQGVLERTGVTPAQIVDWLALIGDSADNIPGVPGVGPKTAARWLSRWQNIDALAAHQAELKPEKLRLAFLDSLADVRRNLELTRLRQDLEVPPLAELQVGTPDFKQLLAFYHKYELNAFAQELMSPTLF